MRHCKKISILNRPADHRRSLLRNLMTSLFLYGKVKTTDAKAKALQSQAERLVSQVKSQEGFNAIRTAKATMFTEEASRKLINYAEKTDKSSGFTRATKIGYRSGDNALLVQIDLI